LSRVEESEVLRSSALNTEEYDGVFGTTRRKKVPTNTIVNVAMANRRSKPAVSSGNAREDMAEK